MQYHGRAAISIDGQTYRSRPGATLNLGGTAREAQALDNGEVGYVESTAPATVEFSIPLTTDLNVERLRHFTNANVVFTSDVGLSWLIAGAFTTDPVSLAAEGLAFRMSGPPATQL
ncbi:MAG TPA: phage tail tube protein [Pseudomonas sp.]|uniref:phage tail tube protein n=1 Tax=Pseudomonas sp. TaxID=306 RepID=UPI002CE3D1D3|nr:phage tail tube protein [Pseudomonas sp.]HWH86357.1 phage tail tube protein [Pseudomonas sp.]